MNKNKIFWIVVGVIVVALVVTLIVVNVNKNNVKAPSGNIEDEYEQGKDKIDLPGKDNVEVKPDGTTENKSDALKKDHKLENLVISGLSVKYMGGQTEITGTIKNSSGSDVTPGDVKIIVKDSNGKTFLEINSYIGKVKANSSKALSVTTQADISNMKDLEFIKK